MGEIITAIALGGIYVIAGIVYLARTNMEYKKWYVNKEEGGEK